MLSETDPETASQLMDAASQFGIEMTWCRDGAEALFAVGAESPNVLVIAAQTDTVDAATITTAVRRRSDLPILVGATPGDDELARRALVAGASAAITLLTTSPQ